MKKIYFEKYYLELKQNPGKLFGLVYIYIFIIGMVFGIYYVNNIGAVTRQTIPPGVPDTTTQSDLKIVEAKVIPAVDLNKVLDPDKQTLDKGKNSYTTICSSCHGEAGDGKGPAGTSLNPPPRNFTSGEGWKNGQSLSGIYKTLEEGIPGSPMISYNYLSPDERLAMANYIRTNFIPKAPPVTQQEVTTLDQTYNLSQGTEIAAQIPVNQAMELYLSENKSKTDKIINSMREISSDESEGGKIFKRIVSDRSKAVISLAQQNVWKNDKNKFRGLVTNGINRNGFNSEVNYLNENDWDALYIYLVSIF